MFHKQKYSGSRVETFRLLLDQLNHLTEGEEDQVANLANASALLHQYYEDINWVGFYLWKNRELVLGPFQGLPACIRIPEGRGVCGTAAKRRETVRVEDVHQFPGHIACDAASQSEIVVPLLKNGELLGVLDIDSPRTGRFDETDQTQLEEFCLLLASRL